MCGAENPELCLRKGGYRVRGEADPKRKARHGDEQHALCHAAADNSAECHGTCWLIDYLANQTLISFTGAITAYDLIRKNRRNPPFDECKALLRNGNNGKNWNEDHSTGGNAHHRLGHNPMNTMKYP